MLAGDKPVRPRAFAVLWEFGHYFRGRTTCGPFLGVNCCKAQMPDLVHPCGTSRRGGRDESVVFLRHLASWLPSLLHVCDQARASSEPLCNYVLPFGDLGEWPISVERACVPRCIAKLGRSHDVISANGRRAKILVHVTPLSEFNCLIPVIPPPSSSSSLMVLRLALLVCDTPVPAVVKLHGNYPEIYDTWLKASNITGVRYELTPFDVVNHPETYPDPEEFDATILTGSAASAYSPLPWIQTLTQYIRDLASFHPRVKIVGICFGHQIIAQALGAQVVPNGGLWEIGVSKVRLTKAGVDIFGEDDGDTINIQQIHKDHILNLPPNFTLLGSSTACPVQGMVQVYGTNQRAPSEKIDPSNIHILTIQGHPEFTASIVQKIIEVRAERGIFNQALAEKARRDAVKAHDGPGRIGIAVWRVLASGQERTNEIMELE